MASLARPARIGFAVVAWVFVACVAIQIYLAGLGVFDDPSAFVTHRDFGYLFGLLTLVLIVLALVGRLPRRVLAASVLLLAMFALQSLFVAFRQDVPAFAALHPRNGFGILIVAIWVAWTTRTYARSARA